MLANRYDLFTGVEAIAELQGSPRFITDEQALEVNRMIGSLRCGKLMAPRKVTSTLPERRANDTHHGSDSLRTKGGISEMWANANPSKELPEKKDSFELGKREQVPGNVDIELGLQGDLTVLRSLVKDIENLLNTLTKLLKDLQSSNEESKVVTKASAMKEVKKRMEKDVNEVTKVARLAKSKVEQLNKDNAANRQKPGFCKGSGVDRSRTTTTVALTKRLRERILEFQTLREEIQKEYRDVVERRVFTVTGERANEETIDKLIETGDGEQIFQRAIQEQGRGRVLDTLQEIQERHDAVKEIEKKLLDLQQATGAAEHIQTGTNLLQKAKKLQKNTRKWTCIAIIILLIIVLVVILSLKPWSWGK
ncbi:hypothetical protein C2845_PM06G30260 [Panicum miliaceum]|uniref:Syntaxin N-terminal domain-containing protein n=1 Tax=Panicum miliaceum TaxID=4540 RepID=A0A3L6RAN3_PANMI|nr:hypothetical protein C2845_PM06G30260 [Panicum miliaceum]